MSRQYGKVTDEEVERVKALIGIERRHSSWAPDDDLEVTKDTIRRFAYAIGDDNPLWLDPAYAAKSPYRALTGPPYMIMRACERANGGSDGFPGCHGIWANAGLEWKKPIKHGDVLTGYSKLTGIRVVEGRFAGPAALMSYTATCVDQNKEVVGLFHREDYRFERGEAKSRSKYGQAQLAQYTKDDIESIRAHYKNEVRRGSVPLWWDDVAVGEQIPSMIKGPTTITSKLAFEAINRGWPRGWVVGHKLAFELFDKHPGLPFINEQGVPEPAVAIHWMNERCQRFLGLPGAYDAAYERIGWTANMLTNWIGDHGFLKRLTVKFPMFNLLGDTTWCKGKVVDKKTEGNEHIVVVQVWNENQRRHTVTEGEAEVILPKKGAASAIPV